MHLNWDLKKEKLGSFVSFPYMSAVIDERLGLEAKVEPTAGERVNLTIFCKKEEKEIVYEEELDKVKDAVMLAERMALFFQNLMEVIHSPSL